MPRVPKLLPNCVSQKRSERIAAFAACMPPASRALTPLPPLLTHPPRGREGSASTVGCPEIVWIQVPHAAIDADHLPGDKVRQVGGEKLDHLGAIFRLSQTSHGNVGHQLLLDLPE